MKDESEQTQKRIGKRIGRPAERRRNPPKTKTLNKPKSFLIYYKQARQEAEHNNKKKEIKNDDDMAICRQSKADDMRGMGRKNQG